MQQGERSAVDFKMQEEGGEIGKYGRDGAENRYGGETMDCYYAEYCEMHKYAGGGEVAEWLSKDHRPRER